MSSFCAFIDFGEGRAGFESSGRSLESREAGLILASDSRLDNRKELLSALGEDLSGKQADAELILAAYRLWGEHCPEHLLGDFAFVVWDPLNRRLFGARDPLGVRSLYFMRDGSRFGVASTIRPLLEHPLTPRRVDLVAIGDYLSSLTSEPERTFFQDVHRLAPGHTFTATPQDIQIQRFWDVMGLAVLSLSKDDAAQHFLELFRQAVRDRLEAPNGSVGIAMSGGLDSTSVAAVAAQLYGERGTSRLTALSFVFDQVKDCDERHHIGAVSEALGIDTLFIDAERFWFLGDEDVYVPPLETPEMSWESPFSQMLQALRQRGGHVLLTGHGADDLMLGSRFVYADRLRRGDLRVFGEIWRYSRSRQYGWRPFYHLLAEPQLSRGTASALRRRFGRHARVRIPAWINSNFVRQTGLAERWVKSELGPIERSAFGQMHQRLVSRPNYYRSIEWYNRNAEPLGIEVRHPFLDRRLVEFILTLPPEHLFQLGERKTFLRQALTGVLPDSVRLRRQKVSLKGFVDFSLKKEADKIQRLLTNMLSEKLGILNGEAVRRTFVTRPPGDSTEEHGLLWNIVTLEMWLRRHLHTFDAKVFNVLASERKLA